MGLPGWKYRKTVTLSRASGAVTDHRMKLVVGESSGSAGAAVHCGGLCQSSFNDLRFTDVNDVQLFYWIESISGVSPNQVATIWIKFNSIGTGATNFHMYYGNAAAPAASNGVDTFIFFDHFDGSALDTNKWQGDTSYASVADSIVSMLGPTSQAVKAIFSKTTFGPSFLLRVKGKLKQQPNNYDVIGAYLLDRSQYSGIYNEAGIKTITSSDGTGESSTTSNWTSNVFNIWDIAVIGGVKSRFYENGIELTGSPKTTKPPDDSSLRAMLLVFQSISICQADWIFISDYLDTDASWGAWGDQETMTDSWLEGWTYRKSVPLNRVSGAVTDYQMKVLVGESSGATGENVDCGGLVLSNFNDLRFTKADGVTPLDYWIESITGSSPNQLATVWIEFDSVGISDTLFYMYYGNASASAVSNGTNTFLFFDDFNGTAVDTAKWIINNGSPAVAESIVTFNGPAYERITTIDTYESGYAFRCRMNMDASYVGGAAFGEHVGLQNIADTEKGFIFRTYNSAWTLFHSTIISARISGWNILEIARTPDPSMIALLNDTLVATHSSPTTISTVAGGGRCGSTSGTYQADWALIRYYLTVEPAWGAWGAQETAPGAFLSGWTHRKKVTLSSATPTTDYQMKVLIGESAGSVGAAVHCEGLCLSSFNDLRFTQEDGTTLLPYWIESISGSTPNQVATVWIKFNSIGTNLAQFYMYYGKADATAASSGEDTFILFDHFDGDLSKWTGDTAYASVASSILTMVGPSPVAVKTIHSIVNAGKNNFALRTFAKIKAQLMSYDLIETSDAARNHIAGIYNAANTKKVVSKDGTTPTEADSNWTSDTYKFFDILVLGGVNSRYFENGVELTASPKTTNPPNSAEMGAGVFAYATYSVVKADWVLLRNYEAVEPAWGAWGAQEELPSTDRYWVPGGNSNFHDSSNWSLSSGGESGASAPTTDQVAIFDANSGATEVIITEPVLCRLNTDNIDPSMVFNVNSGGSLSLQEDLLGIDGLNINEGGSLTTNDYNISVNGWIYIYKAALVDFGASTVTQGTGTVSNITYTCDQPESFDASLATFIFNLELSAPDNQFFDAGPYRYGSLQINTNGFEIKIIIQAATSFDSLDINGDGDITFSQGANDLVINDSSGLSLDGSTPNGLKLHGDGESVWSVVMTTGVVNATNCLLKNSHASGGATFNSLYANGNSDDGGNTGWNFGSKVKRYWVPPGQNGGDFHNTLYWSETSGGAGGASVPTTNQIAVFDDKSFVGIGLTTANIDITHPVLCEIETSNVQEKLILKVKSGGELELQEHLSGFFALIVFSGGLFDTKDFDVSVSDYIQTYGGAVVTFGSSTIKFGENLVNSSGIIIDDETVLSATDSVIILYTTAESKEGADSFFEGGNQVFGDVRFYLYPTDNHLRLSGDNSYHKLSMVGDGKIICAPALFYTEENNVSHILDESGLTLQGSNPGGIVFDVDGISGFVFSMELGVVNAQNCHLKKSTAIGGATFNALLSQGNVDGGGNTGWDFGVPPVDDNRYWVNGTGYFNDPAHWAKTSGGAGGNSVPDATKNVIIDENSSLEETWFLLFGEMPS